MNSQLSVTASVSFTDHEGHRDFLVSEYNRVHNADINVIQRCIDNIEQKVAQYESVLVDPLLNHKLRSHFIATWKVAVGVLEKIKILKIKIGSGASTSDDNSSGRIDSGERILWRDLQSAFNSRMMVSVIINLRHKDIQDFLDESKTISINKVSYLL